MNESKTVLFWGTMDLEALKPFPEAVQRSSDRGVKFLGAGAGDQSFMNEIAQRRVDKICKVLDIAKNLEDPHMELLLLRSCIGVPKFAFLLRMCPPELIQSAIESLDDNISSFLSHILNVDSISPDLRSEIALPVRDGGLGIPIVQSLAPIQYICARRNYVLSLPPSAFLATTADSLDDRIRAWNSEFDPRFHVKVAEIMTIKKRPQSILQTMLSQAMQDGLLGPAIGNRKARLISNFSSPAAWTTVPPLAKLGLAMDPGSFRFALRFRLGLNVRGSQVPCIYCSRAMADKAGLHDSRCPRIWHQTHNAVRDCLYQLMQSANMDVRKEVPGLFNDGTEDRPADILYTTQSGKSFCLDVSCVSYHEPDGLAKRDADKLKKYAARCESNNLEFIPLSFNTVGGMSEPFKNFIKKYARFAAELTSFEDDGRAFDNAMQAIQFRIAKIVGQTLRDRVANDLSIV